MQLILSVYSSPSTCDICRKTFEKYRAAFLSIDSDRSLGGGNTDWEEKYIGQYAFSELHGIEIMEQAFKSLNDKEARFLFDIEQDLSDFWSQHLRTGKSNIDDIEHLMCVENLKHCCPWNSFGRECTSCPMCLVNKGHCDGNGTRTGSGLCRCKPGYSGVTCDKCDLSTHFQKTSDGSGVIDCIPCNFACADGCTDDTPSSCTQCADGYTVSEANGTKSCVDIDECSQVTSPCASGSYCINIEGSFSCKKCPPECSTCFSASQCVSCSPGYSLQDGVCNDIDECSLPNACLGANQKCVNKQGSYTCVCEKGYSLRQGRCIPGPASNKPRRTKQESKPIWTVPFTVEFAKFAGALILVGIILYLNSRNAMVYVSIAVLAVGFVCYYCRTFDVLFDKV